MVTRGKKAAKRPVRFEGHYDVIVVGAGIYGAAHAWEAACRNLSVALFDRGDFGTATSANSLKTIHGGIRYLQNLNVRRSLESKRERDALMRIAPHLVQPLPCVMPSYAWTAKGRVATGMGAGLYNLLCAWDELRSDAATPGLRASMLSKHEIRSHLPEPLPARVNGGIHWYDGQAYDSERLVLSFVLAARQRGAQVCNYMRVSDLIVADNRVRGVVVKDQLDGAEHEVFGTYVIDTGGASSDRAGDAWRQGGTKEPVLAKAVNLVYRCAAPPSAFGMKLGAGDETTASGRLLFAAPWRGRLMIGTWYFPVSTAGSGQVLTAAEYDICTADARRLCGRLIERDTVPSLTHAGLLPVHESFRFGEYPRLAESTAVVDHGRAGGVDGLFTVRGVKYTTARAVADGTIGVIAGRLGDHTPSVTRTQPIYGGDTGDYDEFCHAKIRQYGGAVDERVLRNLLRSYGSSIDGLLRYAAENPELYEPVPDTVDNIKAQIVYAVREELAVRLSDVVVRRIGLGGLGRPSAAAIDCCADIMAAAEGWAADERADNVRELEKYYDARVS